MQKALDHKFLDWDAEYLLSGNYNRILRISSLNEVKT